MCSAKLICAVVKPSRFFYFLLQTHDSTKSGKEREAGSAVLIIPFIIFCLSLCLNFFRKSEDRQR